MLKETWVIVANSSTARILKMELNKKLVQKEIFTHPESRLHDKDLVSSKPGRSYDSNGSARHIIEPPTSPHHQESINFAKFLSDHLEIARKSGTFAQLYLIASPTFLGLLRQHIHPHTSSLIVHEINKDMTSLNLADIEDHLRKLNT